MERSFSSPQAEICIHVACDFTAVVGDAWLRLRLPGRRRRGVGLQCMCAMQEHLEPDRPTRPARRAPYQPSSKDAPPCIFAPAIGSRPASTRLARGARCEPRAPHLPDGSDLAIWQRR
jgi:hypothetical protein